MFVCFFGLFVCCFFVFWRCSLNLYIVSSLFASFFVQFHVKYLSLFARLCFFIGSIDWLVSYDWLTKRLLLYCFVYSFSILTLVTYVSTLVDLLSVYRNVYFQLTFYIYIYTCVFFAHIKALLSIGFQPFAPEQSSQFPARVLERVPKVLEDSVRFWKASAQKRDQVPEHKLPR